MIVLLHILIACASITITTLTYIKPSRFKLQTSYGLITLTIGSGLYLIVISPAHMLETCLVGLGYLGIVVIGTLATRAKLAAIAEKTS